MDFGSISDNLTQLQTQSAGIVGDFMSSGPAPFDNVINGLLLLPAYIIGTFAGGAKLFGS